LRRSDAAEAANHLAAAKDLLDREERFGGKRPNRPIDQKWFDWTITRILLNETQQAANHSGTPIASPE
jgi:hypothetical protein